MKYLVLIPLSLFVCFCSFYNGGDNSSLKKLKSVAFPDYRAFCEFQLQTVGANANACFWVRMPGESTRKTKFKMTLNDFCTGNLCVLKKLVADSLIPKARIDSVSAHLDILNQMYRDLTHELATVNDYNDPVKVFPEQAMFVDEDGPATVVFDRISKELVDIRTLLDNKIDELLTEAGK
jgi:hypothetical protein